jgi:hypothetical protein
VARKLKRVSRTKTNAQTGPKGISNARLAEALRKNGGNQSEAGRVLRIGRSTVCERVAKSSDLQQALREGVESINDIAQGHLIRLIKKGDFRAVTFQLDRAHPDYTSREQAMAVTQPSPQSQALRQAAYNALMEMVLDRARRGLPPIFPEDDMVPALSPPSNARATP